MKEPTEAQQGSHSTRFANLHFVLAWMLVNIASTATAAPPSIDYPPRSQTVILYQQAAFGVIASGTAPFSYQWRKDGVPIPGATKDQVVVPQAHFSDSGQYSVVVSNAEGSVTSAESGLTVNPPKAGDVDFSFVWGGSINGTVESVVVQPDGKILIGGGFTTVHGAACGGIARLNVDGSTDYTFMQGLSGASAPFNSASVYSIAVQSDGKVLIGGRFSTVNGVSRTNIARVNADGTLDSSFQTGITDAGADFGDVNSHFHDVNSIAAQSDGKVLIGGGFTAVNGMRRTNIARLNEDGTLDSGFQTEISADNSLGPTRVASVAVQSDGKVLLGGDFTMVNGAPAAGIARLNADGTLDSEFQVGLINDACFVCPAPPPFVDTFAVQRGGKVLIGGRFSMVNGAPAAGIARLNADGTLDRGFQNALLGWNFLSPPFVSSVAMQNDGKVLIGGSFTAVNGISRTNIARLNADGALDSGFQNGLAGRGGTVSSVAVQSDGRVLIVGVSELTDNGAGIARLNTDGTLDSGFQNGSAGVGGTVGYWGVDSVVVQSDGKVLIGGYVLGTVNGVSRNAIARLRADGTLDSGFQNGLAVGTVFSIAVQRDGKVLIGGYFDLANGTLGRRIARLGADGTLDNTFRDGLAVSGNGVIISIAVQSDGKVIVGGNHDSAGDVGIARLNADGTRDASFIPVIDGEDNSFAVRSITVQSDGKVLVGGRFTKVNGVNRTNIARLNADGALDSDFQNGLGGANGIVRSIVVQRDGKVLIGGNFATVNNVGRAGIARLNADGTLDSGFQTTVSEGFPPSVESIALQNDGKALIGGYLVNGMRIARLNTDGTLDSSFQNGLSGVEGSVTSVAVQSDGNVLIGGSFTVVNGVPAAGIARLWGSADVPPRIQSVTRGGTDVNLTWDALLNRNYRAQYKETLSANNWTDLVGDISTTTGTASKTDSTLGNASQRFYRVVLLP